MTGGGAEPVEVFDFPCHLTLKAIGRDDGGFEGRVVAAVRAHAPDLGEGAVSSRPSRNGRFLSVGVRVRVRDRAHLETLYVALRGVEGVAYLL